MTSWSDRLRRHEARVEAELSARRREVEALLRGGGPEAAPLILADARAIRTVGDRVDVRRLLGGIADPTPRVRARIKWLLREAGLLA